MLEEPRLVVKVSGKLVSPDDPGLVKQYAKVIVELSRSHRVAVVVGGGRVAREYISAARSFGANRGLQDLLGIEASRLNARLLIAAMHPQAYPEPPRSLEEALRYISHSRIIVAGGFQPGQSTAAVAALLAEALDAEVLVLATTVPGVYTRDPRRHPDAKLIPRLTYTELRRVLEQSVEPGRYELLDPVALSILERSCITLRVVDGRNPENVARVAKGEDVGSTVTC